MTLDRQEPGRLEGTEEGAPQSAPDMRAPLGPVETARRKPSTRFPARGHIDPPANQLMLPFLGQEEVVAAADEPAKPHEPICELDGGRAREMVVAGSCLPQLGGRQSSAEPGSGNIPAKLSVARERLQQARDPVRVRRVDPVATASDDPHEANGP